MTEEYISAVEPGSDGTVSLLELAWPSLVAKERALVGSMGPEEIAELSDMIQYVSIKAEDRGNRRIVLALLAEIAEYRKSKN